MHHANKNIIRTSVLILLLLTFIPMVEALTIIQTVTDTFHYTDDFSFGLKYPATDNYHFTEFLVKQIIQLVRDGYGFAEHVIPISTAFIQVFLFDGYKYFDGQCTICQIVITNTITIIQSNSQTGTNSLQATDTPLNTTITEIILPLAILFVVIGIVAIKFPLAGLSLMITVGVMTFIYLAYLQIFPSWILVIVAIVGAASLAILITKLVGNEQHG